MNSWNHFPPPSRPRAADGIKARSRQGAIGKTWWSQRFTTVLESLGLGNRLTRGKNYARRGQVLSLEVEPGRVTASVQGSRVQPYKVWLAVTAYGKAQWSDITAALAANASYVARLLNQEMPEDIEDVFAQLGLPLFPQSTRELGMDCSCPDHEVPCKHLAAVMYLLAEAFDDDPFLILQWRGRGRDDLLDALRATRSGTDVSSPVEAPSLRNCLQAYFALQAPLDLPPQPATPSGLILDNLPAIDVEVGGLPLVEVLRPAYTSVDG